MARGRRTPLMNEDARIFLIDPIDTGNPNKRGFPLPFAFYEGEVEGDAVCKSVTALIDDDTMVITGTGTGATGLDANV